MPLEVGVSPHTGVQDFLDRQQGLLQTTGRYTAFAQQRLHADHIAALVRQAQVHLGAAKQRQEADANARRSHLVLTPGQGVMLKTISLKLSHWPSKKLFPLWIGPFEVLRVASPVSYELALPRHWHIHDVFHVNLLKPYRCNGQQHPSSPFTYLAGQP